MPHGRRRTGLTGEKAVRDPVKMHQRVKWFATNDTYSLFPLPLEFPDNSPATNRTGT
jgi:hypothetical protein